MQKAVCNIRNCFRELTRTAGDKTEVMEGEIEHRCEEGDSRNMGQVVPSIGENQKQEVRDQPVVTSGDRPTKVSEGRDNTNPRSPTPNGQMQKTSRFRRTNNDESKHPDRGYDGKYIIHHQKMIKEEIKNVT